MNRYSLPFALSFLSSALFAQSAPVTVVEPAQRSGLQVSVRPFTVQTIEPRFRVEVQEPIVTTITPREPIVRVLPQNRIQVQPFAVARGSAVAALDEDGPREGDAWLGLSLVARKDGAARLEVVQVFPGSPAQKAGVQAGDKLVALSGHAVSKHENLLDVLRGHHPGDHLGLTVERTVKVKLGATDTDEHRALLGVTPGTAAGSDASDGHWKNGTVIEEITGGSAAQKAGLSAGSRIAAVDGSEVNTFEELQKAIQSHQPGESVELRIQRELGVELAPRPAKSELGRAITGRGTDAFTTPPAQPPAAELPGQPGQMGQPGQPGQPGRGGRLLTPDGKRGFYWSTPAEPQAKQPGQAAPERELPKEQSEPNDQDGRRQLLRGLKRGPNSGGANELSAQLLDEIRALRAEVADLRREIEVLREKRR